MTQGKEPPKRYSDSFVFSSLHYQMIKSSRKKTSIQNSQKRSSASISKKLPKPTVKMNINHIKNSLFNNILINNLRMLKIFRIYGPE